VLAAEDQEGFLGALLLVRDNGEAMAIDLADSLEHMRANERSDFYQAQVAKFRDKIVGGARSSGLLSSRECEQRSIP
jgi:hypothetical protein